MSKKVYKYKINTTDEETILAMIAHFINDRLGVPCKRVGQVIYTKQKLTDQQFGTVHGYQLGLLDKRIHR